jgi:outer membrane protein OmpA-like peptidoglycan-associated protein
MITTAAPPQNEHAAAHPAPAVTRPAPTARGVAAVHVSNQAALRRLAQTKLAVSRPGDAHEREADRVAHEAMRLPEPAVQRACACGGACESCRGEHKQTSSDVLQPKPAGAVTAPPAQAPTAVHDVLGGSGRPLDAGTRAFFEPRFGYDLSRVRVHTDTRAAESAHSLNALAYTVGRDIAFASGQYEPGTDAGKHLLAHELTHVMQQAGGGPEIQRFVPCTRAGLSLEECPPREPGEIAQARSSPMIVEYIEQPEKGYLIYDFAVDDSMLKPSALTHPNWNHMVQALSDKTTQWNVIGLADCHGPDALNESLRLDRAAMVFAFLPDAAASQVISVTGAKLFNCITDNTTREDRTFNRAVLITREKQTITFEPDVIEGTRPVPKPQAQPTADCRDQQKNELAAAQPIAVAMVEKAMEVFRERARRPEIRALLAKYFNDPTGNWRIYSGLKNTLEGLNTSVKLECENKGSFMYDRFCPNDSTRVRTAYVRRFGFRVHLCEAAFGRGDLALAETLVHEFSHMFDFTDDEVYCWKDGGTACSKLSRWDAYDNADSFSSFAAEVYVKGL